MTRESIVDYSYSIPSNEGKKALENEFCLDSDSEVRRRCSSSRFFSFSVHFLVGFTANLAEKNEIKNHPRFGEKKRRKNCF